VHLTNEVEAALNNQIRDEFYASYLYLSMAAWFEQRHLPGFANWYRVQSQEEFAHAMRLFDYLHRRRGQVLLQAIAEPTHDFASPRETVAQAFEHEQMVSQSIGEIHDLAARVKDRATVIEMDWFVTEQVEEEENAEDLLERVSLVSDDPSALLLLDEQLGRRQLAAPVAGAA